MKGVGITDRDFQGIKGLANFTMRLNLNQIYTFILFCHHYGELRDELKCAYNVSDGIRLLLKLKNRDQALQVSKYLHSAIEMSVIKRILFESS